MASVEKEAESQQGWDWSSLIGYQLFQDNLRRVHRQECLPPVVALSGRSGTGKRRLALWMAALSLCDDGSGCGCCKACQQIQHGHHRDVLRLSGEASLNVEDAKAIQEHLRYGAPSRAGARRTVVVTDIERMSTAVANRLLKTFEESPEGSLIILTSSRYERILPTIRSRCINLRIPRLGFKFAWPELEHSSSLAGIGREECSVLYRRYGCSIGRTLERLNAVISQKNGDGTGDYDDLSPEHIGRQLSMALGTQDSINALAGLLRMAKSPKKPTLERLLVELERAMNESYRENLLQQGSLAPTKKWVPSSVALAKRRQMIRNLKRLVLDAHVTLNWQLSLETLAFTTNCDSHT